MAEALRRNAVHPKVVQMFSRLFGVALVAHVVGNWGQADLTHTSAWVNLAVGLSGVALSLRPGRWLLITASLLTVGSALVEMPVTGNHWVIAALVGASVVVTAGRSDRYVPTGRWILLIFYSFAAFSKLNAGFFDPSSSCALFYTNQWLDGFGLSQVVPGSSFASILIWMTALIELAVPALFAWKRTRYVGVAVASAFHTLISFDLNQHFYDFTAVLLALFLLLLPDRSVEAIADWVARVSDFSRRVFAWVWILLSVTLILMAVSPPTVETVELLNRLPFVLWTPFALAWLWGLLAARKTHSSTSWNPGIAGGLVVVIAFLNGLTPYTEVKTGYGFNMYSNLVTAQGRSNHFLVRKTLPLRDGYQNLVEIVDTSDPGLASYKEQGYLLAEPQFRRYLAGRSDVDVTFRLDGQTFELSPASESAYFTNPGPWWWRFFPLRALDVNSPPRCQAVFLAAL